MSDLVEQLRHHAFDRSNSYRSLTLEAAKAFADAQREIEQLREALAVIGGLLIEGRIEEAKAMTRAFDYTEPELEP